MRHNGSANGPSARSSIALPSVRVNGQEHGNYYNGIKGLGFRVYRNYSGRLLSYIGVIKRDVMEKKMETTIMGAGSRV